MFLELFRSTLDLGNALKIKFQLKYGASVQNQPEAILYEI